MRPPTKSKQTHTSQKRSCSRHSRQCWYIYDSYSLLLHVSGYSVAVAHAHDASTGMMHIAMGNLLLVAESLSAGHCATDELHASLCSRQRRMSASWS